MNKRTSAKFSMTYRDVEGTTKTFTGKDAYPIERWISDFEYVAELFERSEIQKVVFAKKSLSGPSKMLVDSEGVVKTWKKLKTILRDEFLDEVNSAQVHEMLTRRKLKKEETLQEYYYAMKELAARGKIEAEALMKYVIDGIPDDTQNKLLLYGAKKLTDFKEKLKIYETIRKKTGQDQDDPRGE